MLLERPDMLSASAASDVCELAVVSRQHWPEH